MGVSYNGNTSSSNLENVGSIPTTLANFIRRATMLKYVGIILCVLLLSLSVAFLAVSMIYGDVLFTFVGIGFCIFGAMEMHKETSQLGNND